MGLDPWISIFINLKRIGIGLTIDLEWERLVIWLVFIRIRIDWEVDGCQPGKKILEIDIKGIKRG